MNITNIKLTQSQQLLVNALLSMLASALVSAAQAAYQYITQNGTINLAQVVAIFAGVLWATFSAALIAYIPAHVQQELESWKDTAMLAQTELAKIEGKQQTPVAAPVSPVVIHISGSGTVSSVIPDQTVSNYVPAVSQDVQSLTTPHAQVQQISFPVLAQTQSSDILGNIPMNSTVAQGLPLNDVTGQYAIYGAPAQP